MYQKIIDLLKLKNYTLGSAESFTGGLFAATITSYQGVSSFFKGGLVTYWSEIKKTILNVSEDTINHFGVVSSNCALEMVKNVKQILNVDIAVSFTGNAGPSTLENKPCGLVYIGINFKDDINVYELNLKGSREEVRKQAVSFALKKIEEKLLKD